MESPGEILVRAANKRGLVLFVDTDGVVKAYPDTHLTLRFLDLLTRNYYAVKEWLIADAVTIE